MNLECVMCLLWSMVCVMDFIMTRWPLRNFDIKKLSLNLLFFFLKMVNKHPINFYIFYEIDEQEAEHAESLKN